MGSTWIYGLVTIFRLSDEILNEVENGGISFIASRFGVAAKVYKLLVELRKCII
jgi:hypothetical protein